MKRNCCFAVLVLGWLLAASGCRSTAEGSNGATAAAATEKFSVRVAVPALKVADAGDLVFTITPGAGMKWNEEFPATFKCPKAETVTLRFVQPLIRKGDARMDANAKRAVVKVPVKAHARGEETVTVLASFSVCTESMCHIIRDQALDAKVVVR